MSSFKKSSFCNQLSCVAVRTRKDNVEIKDTKNPESKLSFSKEEWNAFVKGVKNGEFD